MSKPINKTCPHCQQPFEARRKNQRYCTEECRQDANNAVAKVRYASFRQDAPKLKVLQKQVKNLKEELAFLIGVISGVKVSEENTLTYKGSRYKRGNRMDRTGPRPEASVEPFGCASDQITSNVQIPISIQLTYVSSFQKVIRISL